MAPRNIRTPSPPSTEAMAIETSSEASKPRNQAKTAASSVSPSSSFHKGKRGRPKKLVSATRSNGDLKNSAGAPAFSIFELHTGPGNSTPTTTKKVQNPEIFISGNEKLETVVAGEVSLKETANPEPSFSPTASNEGAADDKYFSGNQPSRLNLIRKKGLRKGKPNRAPVY